MPIVTDSLMESVSEKIIADILSGKLKVGNCLSSKRQLANKYSVSRTVIDRVLEYLVDMGYVEKLETTSYRVINFNRFENINDLINFSKFDNQNLSEKEISDIFLLKCGLDYLSIKLITLPISDEEYYLMKNMLAPLSKTCAHCEKSYSVEYATIIYEFYTKLAKLSGNVYLPWLYYAFRTTNIKIISSYVCNNNMKTIYEKASTLLEHLHAGNRIEAVKLIDSFIK